MKPFSNVLVSDDLDSSKDGVRRAEAVAEAVSVFTAPGKTALELVHILPLHYVPTEFYPYTDWDKEQSVYLKQQIEKRKKFFSKKFKIEAHLLRGHPVESFLKQANSGHADFIALGTQGRTGFAKLLLGSFSEEILRRTKKPVMTVGPKAQRKKKQVVPGAKSLIVVATDLMTNSENAENFALNLAVRTGAELLLVHGIFDGLHPTLKSAWGSRKPKPSLKTFLDEITTEQSQKLEKRRKSLAIKNPELKISTKLFEGRTPVAEEIVKLAAKSKTAAVVQGTRSLSVLEDFFVGSTSREVVLKANVPVFTVKS